MRYLVSTGDIIWCKSRKLKVARQVAADLSRKLGGKPIEIYDRLRLRKIDGDA